MNPAQTEKRPITADAALMNPVAKILALRSGENLQIFNIDLKRKMKALILKKKKSAYSAFSIRIVYM